MEPFAKLFEGEYGQILVTLLDDADTGKPKTRLDFHADDKSCIYSWSLGLDDMDADEAKKKLQENFNKLTEQDVIEIRVEVLKMFNLP